MAVMMIMESPGTSVEQYDQLNEIMGIHGDEDAPEGLVHHASGHDGDNLVIVDVWESGEALERFFQERLGAAIEQAGLPQTEPRILPVHNRLEGKGSKPGVMVLIEIEDLGPDAYDQMVSRMDAHTADGSNHPAVSHTAAASEGGGVTVVDLWDSPEAFGSFAEEQVGPAGAEVGLGPIEPRFVPVHNTIAGRAAQTAG
jgi:hypothetical protein